QGAYATDENRHLGGSQREQLRPIHEQFLRRPLVSPSEIVAEAVRGRFQYGKRVNVRLLLRRVRAARREGNFHIVAGFLRSFLDGGAAAQNDQVRQRNLLPAGLRGVE